MSLRNGLNNVRDLQEDAPLFPSNKQVIRGVIPEEEVQQAIVAQRQEEPQSDIVIHDAAIDHDGTIWIGQFQLSKKGLVIPEGTDEQTWDQLGKLIKRFTTTLAWFWGDWLIYGALHFDWTEDRYQRALEQSGYEYTTLRDYAYVARNVPLSIRIDNLSFAHHRAVASFEKTKDQEVWLARALEGGWSAATLVRQIERASNPLLTSGGKRGKNPLLDRSTKKAFNSVWKAVEAGAGVNKDDVKRIKAWVREIEEMLNAK